jgi:hypothetical protein
MIENARIRPAEEQFEKELTEYKDACQQAQSQLAYMDFSVDEAYLLSLRLTMVGNSVEKVVDDSMVYDPGCEQLWIEGARGGLNYLKHGVRDHSLEYFPKPARGFSFPTAQQEFLNQTRDSIFKVCDEAIHFYALKHRSELASLPAQDQTTIKQEPSQ